MPEGSPHQPTPSLLYLIGRVDQGIRREMRARLEQWNLSLAGYTALSVLKERPGLSNAQLARRSLITPQSMIEVLAALEERGLVRRAADPAHARILRAELTARGRKLLAAIQPAIDTMQDQMFAGVPAAQRRQILRALVGVMDRLAAGLDASAGKAQ